MLKDFLYFLVDDQGRSFRVRDGIVEATSVPTPLPITPDGWQEKSIKWGRSQKYLALVRSFTTPLKFAREGAKIISTIVREQGTEAKVYLVINRLDKRFGGEWKHRFFYRGELDLSTAQGDDVLVTCNVMEGELSKLFKANENTTYELDIDVPEAVTVKMDGVAMKSVQTFTLLKSLAAQSMGRKQMLPMTKTLSEGRVFHAVFVNDYGSLIDGAYNEITTDPLSTSDKWLFKAGQAMQTSIRIKGAILGSSGNAGNTWKVETSLGQNITLGTIEATLTGVEVPFDFEQPVTLAANETVFVYRTSTTFNNNGLWNYVPETQMLITTIDRADPTYIKALRPDYIGQQLLNKITGSTDYVFSSSVFSGEWNNLLLTGMDAVRGLTTPKMKMSFSRFFDAYSVPLPLCLDISGKTLSIEYDTAAFVNTEILDLGEVRGLKWGIATDYLYSTVRIGYPDVQTEDLNGKDEPNTQHIYSSPQARVVKELSLITDVFASMYQIENTRTASDKSKATTNLEVDNDSCFLHVKHLPTTVVGGTPETFYELYRDTYDSVTGILDPASAFNLELTPKRCLLRHGAFLRSIYYWLDSKQLMFQSSTRNAELKTVKAGVTIQEKSNVNIGDLASPLFIPVKVDCTSKMPYDTPEVMSATPNGTIRFSWLGNDLTGYGIDVSVQPANRAEQDTTLLLAPGNNLNYLM